MSWANAAILSAVLLAAINIVDSHLITKRMPSLKAFLVAAALIAVIYGCLILFLFPLPQDAGNATLLMAVLAGVLRGAGIVLLLSALQTEEVSRVIPVVNIHPVFVAMLAVPLLGESLGSLEWLAIVITVAGAVIISLRPGMHRIGAWLGRPVLWPFLASIFLAGSNLASKDALENISFWNMYAIGGLSMAVVFLAYSLRPSSVAQLRCLGRSFSTTSILVLNETLVPVSAVLLFWSIERGPVSLVSALAGTQPVFVFGFALVLSRTSHLLLEEPMSGRTIQMRLFAIALIVGGITLIHLA